VFTLANWEKYNSNPVPIFRTRREAERVAESLRMLRAWVEVVEVES
jgi:hypothetical protein